MKNINLLLKLIYSFVFLAILCSCVAHKELMRFESSDNVLVFTNKHISAVSLESDAVGKKYALITFSADGQKLVSEFTGNNINNSMSIFSNNEVLMENIVIRDKLNSKSIPFSFGSDEKANKFVNMVQGEL